MNTNFLENHLNKVPIHYVVSFHEINLNYTLLHLLLILMVMIQKLISHKDIVFDFPSPHKRILGFAYKERENDVQSISHDLYNALINDVAIRDRPKSFGS